MHPEQFPSWQGLPVRAVPGSGDLEWRRGMAWALEQALGLVWYYDASSPAMAALGRRTLTRLLEATPAT